MYVANIWPQLTHLNRGSPERGQWCPWHEHTTLHVEKETLYFAFCACKGCCSGSYLCHARAHLAARFCGKGLGDFLIKLIFILGVVLPPFFLHILYLLVVVQSLSCVWLFVTLWTAAYQVSLYFTVSQSLLKLVSIESVMPFNHLILLCPFLPPVLNLSRHQGLFQWIYTYITYLYL